LQTETSVDISVMSHFIRAVNLATRFRVVSNSRPNLNFFMLPG